MFHVERRLAAFAGRVIQRLRALWWRPVLLAPDPYRPLTDDEMRQFIAAHRWKFARTAAATNPHEYTLRENAESAELFLAAVQTIRDRGYKRWFWRKPYLCLDIDGFRYWTMGNPLEVTKLINRARNEP